jgi:hypothetical protein
LAVLVAFPECVIEGEVLCFIAALPTAFLPEDSERLFLHALTILPMVFQEMPAVLGIPSSTACFDFVWVFFPIPTLGKSCLATELGVFTTLGHILTTTLSILGHPHRVLSHTLAPGSLELQLMLVRSTGHNKAEGWITRIT